MRIDLSVKLSPPLSLEKYELIHFYTDKITPVGLLIEQSIQELACRNGNFPQTQHLVIQFAHTQYYLSGHPKLDLFALLSIHMKKDASVHIEGSVFPATPERAAQLQSLAVESISGDDSLKQFCDHHSFPWLRISDPWILSPLHIPKPWGQEIWYTGIEERGQSRVMAGAGSIPLPWLLELTAFRIGLPERSAPILLKVLDPLAEDVYGDLYFELHREKQEVYVVTDVDRKAWPEGVGAIQLGFAPDVLRSYSSTDEFKQAYLSAVKAYEQVRRLIDAQVDEKRISAGVGLQQPITSSQLKKWLNDLSQLPENKELFDSECELREAMNSFVASHPLKAGDVVTVPRLVPHALQHGVKVVEFQTPVYERKILSFGQKVLTQSNWDTEAALELVNVDFSHPDVPELIIETADLRIERIVNFDDFEVIRVQLDGSYAFPAETYSILMVLQGQLSVGEEHPVHLGTGAAALIPAAEKIWRIHCTESSQFLLAFPKKLAK